MELRGARVGPATDVLLRQFLLFALMLARFCSSCEASRGMATSDPEAVELTGCAIAAMARSDGFDSAALPTWPWPAGGRVVPCARHARGAAARQRSKCRGDPHRPDRQSPGNGRNYLGSARGQCGERGFGGRRGTQHPAAAALHCRARLPCTSICITAGSRSRRHRPVRHGLSLVERAATTSLY